MDPAASPINRTIFSTALMEPQLRTRAYRKWISPIADIHTPGNEPVDASIAAYRLGKIMVAHSSSSPARYLRDERIIERGCFNDSVLLWLSQDGRARGEFGKSSAIELKEGDIFLSDLSQPVKLDVDDSEHINLLVPRRLLSEPTRPLHGSILRKEHLPCRMLTQHLLRLVDMLPLLDDAHATTVSQATLAVVRRCFQIASHGHGSHLWADRIREEILTYISTQIGDSDLSVATLQRRFRISRTQLYRLFADLGGVKYHIRKERLELVLRALEDYPSQTISEIIFRFGFSNERQFQRAFRAHYGMTASEARDR